MPIYVGTQKISVSGVKKVYVGTQLVYQDAPVLTSITLSGQTTSLNRGSAFSFGGTVTANYSNGSTANVTSSTTFSGYNMNTAGTYTVTASYTENGVTVTATYSLTVNPIWTTIWEGSRTCKITGYDNTTSGTATNFTQSKNGTGYTPKIRITFSVSATTVNTSQLKRYFNNSNTPVNSSPSSPVTFNAVGNGNIALVGARVASNSSTSTIYKQAYLQKVNDTTNNRIKFNLVAGAGSEGGAASSTAQVTVTKIEQYY